MQLKIATYLRKHAPFLQPTVLRQQTPGVSFAVIAVAFAGTCLSGIATADTVELVGGGHLTGEVSRNDQRKIVIVRLDDDVQIAIQTSRVRRIIDDVELTDYQHRAQQAASDAEAHYQLGRWCMEPGNVPGRSSYYKNLHMQRAIELNPDHEYARASLNYIKHQGDWVVASDLMHDRGMVRRGKTWVTPEVVAIEESAKKFEKSSKSWIAEVAKQVTIVLRGPGRKNRSYADALEFLRSIDDPIAAEAITRQLSESRPGSGRGKREHPRQLRQLWVELLGKFKNSTSVEALVRAGIEEPDNAIREMALEQLKSYGSGSAVASYVRVLKTSNSNQQINRAARALSWFPDPELAMTYITALNTTHTTDLGSTPGMNVGFGDQSGSQGGGGLTTGGQRRVITQKKQNPAVLALVKSVIPDVDYGYDELKWQQYIAAQKTRYSGDLRRDP